MPNAFSVILTLGALVSLLWLSLPNLIPVKVSRPPARKILPTARIDAGLSALAGGLMGARISFVFLHWNYYASNPSEILLFWQGGLSWIGGACGAILGLGIFVALLHLPFWLMADVLALPAAVMALSSWAGCLLDGCAYGRAMKASLWTPPATDMFGGWTPRWPTQTVGVLYSLLVLALLYWLADRRLQPGTLAMISLSLITAGAFALSFTRGDPMLLLLGLRLDTVGAGIILTLAFVGLALRYLRR